MTGAPILEAERLSCAFGGVRAVDDVSLKFWPGEIVGLIGPNGAGKTTLVNLMTGVLRPTAGRVRFEAGTSPPSGPFKPRGAGSPGRSRLSSRSRR